MHPWETPMNHKTSLAIGAYLLMQSASFDRVCYVSVNLDFPLQ